MAVFSVIISIIAKQVKNTICRAVHNMLHGGNALPKKFFGYFSGEFFYPDILWQYFLCYYLK